MLHTTTGATATAEAVIMAYAHFRGKRNKTVFSPTLNPQYRAVARTYTQGYEGLQIVGDGPDAPLFASPNALIPLIDSSTALVIVQYPDFLGRIDDLSQLVQAGTCGRCTGSRGGQPDCTGPAQNPRAVRRRYRHRAKGSRWASRFLMAAPTWASSPPRKTTSARSLAGWWVKR